MTEKNPLLDLRSKIDGLDREIMANISARARCAQDVAKIKKRAG